jgi:hypothetical protein
MMTNSILLCFQETNIIEKRFSERTPFHFIFGSKSEFLQYNPAIIFNALSSIVVSMTSFVCPHIILS